MIYDCVSFLHEAGYDAALVHNHPKFRYPDKEIDAPVLFTPALYRLFIKRRPAVRRLMGNARLSLRAKLGGRNAPLDLRPDDHIVVPDFMLPDALQAFPDNPKIYLSQNPFYHLHAHARAEEIGLDPAKGMVRYLGIADVCMDAFELLGAAPVSRFPVAPNLPLFPFQQEKQQLITYMPRKRRSEAALVDAALRRRGALGDFELVAIDGMPQSEVADLLARSLFFVSFLKDEALGFPAAEAMAAGCVVIGYTGIGTREYFDETTGIPIPDNDTMGVVRAVEAALAEYRTDPARLDDLRRHASGRIHATYNRDAFRDGLLAAWKEIEAG